MLFRSGDVADGRVALNGEVILEMIDRKDGAGRVGDMPDDDRTDDNRVAECVVDLLLVVVQRAGSERNLFASRIRSIERNGAVLQADGGRCALVGRRIGNDERVHKVEARRFKRSVIIAPKWHL